MTGQGAEPDEGAAASPAVGSPLEKAQLAFYGLVVFNLVGAVMSAVAGGWDRGPTLVAVTSLAGLGLWLTVGWRRGRFPRLGWLVEGLLLTGYVAVTGGAGLAIGIAFPTLMFAALYGPPLAAWARPIAYATVYATGTFVLSDASRSEATTLSVVMVVGMLFTSQVIHYLRGTLLDAHRNTQIAARNVDQMRQLERMKNAFLSATSHELRTPVTVIQGLAEVVATRSRDLTPEQLQSLLDRLDANSRRLSGLLDDLLDVDRLTRTEISADRRPVDIAALAAGTVAMLDLEGRRITLPPGPVVANADHVMVERIVENLVRNAIKYTPAATPIRIEVTADGEGAVLAVEDDGPGIPDDARLAVFEPFHRLDDSHPSPGTGIGLSLVARFAEAHGGSAWVESAATGGARFCVRIADRPADDADTPRPDPRAHRMVMPRRRPARVGSDA